MERFNFIDILLALRLRIWYLKYMKFQIIRCALIRKHLL